MLNGCGLICTVPFLHGFTNLWRNANGAVCRQPLLSVGSVCRNLIQVAAYPGEPLIELRCVCIKSMDLFVEHGTDVDGHIRTKRIRSLKEILEVQEDRI